jgi:hypothetical protein
MQQLKADPVFSAVGSARLLAAIEPRFLLSGGVVVPPNWERDTRNFC